jgi:hypothetical protein
MDMIRLVPIHDDGELISKEAYLSQHKVIDG